MPRTDAQQMANYGDSTQGLGSLYGGGLYNNAAQGMGQTYSTGGSITYDPSDPSTTWNVTYQFQYQYQYLGGQGNYQYWVTPTNSNVTITTTDACNYFVPGEPETPEQRAARERESREYAAKCDAAIAKAEELLKLVLTDAQRAQYEKSGYFETQVDDRLYRINTGRAMNVELIVGGKAKFKYCALPSDYSPAPDVMLAQLLMLQTDEAKFLATANKTIL